MSDDFEVEFQRSGGFAGIRLGMSVSTQGLPAGQARELRELVDRSDIPALAARPAAPPAGADRFQYDITLRRNDAEHHLTVQDSGLTEGLRALTGWLEAHARRGAMSAARRSTTSPPRRRRS